MDSTGEETPPLSTLPPPRPKLEPPPPPPPKSRPSPVLREDCWSEDATRVLVEAWGSRHLSLNRGHLRQHHWQEVAATVNAAVSAAGKASLRRTHVQCKNRIDTLKKKYKIEKYKSRRTAAYVSPWPFFSRLDFLISGTDGGGGDSPSSASPPPLKTPTPPPPPPPALTNFPVGRRSAKQKRPAPINNSFFSRNFAPVTASSEERESSHGTSSGGGGGGGEAGDRGGRRGEREEAGFGSGCRELAKAIRRFGEVYERVEVLKQEQLIEVEKHRMQFAKDLEYQRMKLLMDTQLQLARIKRSKHSDAADSYL